ncbi:MAG: T9SS type A sorting domain-containing protein [Bacteroidetes bacterium]|nr:T9SS type A sorting domain-containing protein [Bacteroidota bacterium]MBU1115428.1 T9SS type A sorting domain-containing protein [Bacteroidota bacterium]MBU1797571.1 T9SS type A sorting domain-containing protein [Bacteroidota bacterium]
MSDDGTNGDETADDDFWTKEVTFPIYTSSTIQYKYGANWGLASNGGTNDNETGMYGLHHFVNTFIFNHTYIDFWCGDAIDVFGTMGHKDIVNNVEQISSGIPTIYKLEQNYPNPFNPSTTIKYSIPRNTEYYSVNQVTLKVFNILGQEVAELVNEVKSAGNYEINFNASYLTSGVYFYKIQSGKYSSTKKMILLR